VGAYPKGEDIAVQVGMVCIHKWRRGTFPMVTFERSGTNRIPLAVSALSVRQGGRGRFSPHGSEIGREGKGLLTKIEMF